MSIHILVVEDNLALAKTIGDFLELVNISCDFASNGKAGLNLALENQYDAILLDINLPKMNGLQVCEGLRTEGVDVPVLMLTARDTLEDKLAGFERGTDDYLVKPFQMEELAARIKALSCRRSAQTKSQTIGELVLDFDRKLAARCDQQLELTPTGWIILHLLAKHADQLVTRQTLERAIWQDEPPDTDLLKVHLYRLRQQLDKPFDYPMLHTVPNHGFMLRSDYVR